LQVVVVVLCGLGLWGLLWFGMLKAFLPVWNRRAIRYAARKVGRERLLAVHDRHPELGCEVGDDPERAAIQREICEGSLEFHGRVRPWLIGISLAALVLSAAACTAVGLWLL